MKSSGEGEGGGEGRFAVGALVCDVSGLLD